MTTAGDLMTQNPVTIHADATLREAATILQQLDVRHLPVVNEEHEVIGMLSDRDFRALSIPYLADEDVVGGDLQATLAGPVGKLMSGDVLSVERESEASEVVSLMLEHRVGAIPVTDAEGTLVGIVSYVDLLRALPHELA